MASGAVGGMVGVDSYWKEAEAYLSGLIERNGAVFESLAQELVSRVRDGKRLLVFGSGHSALFPLELYHRAGGAAFVVPVVSEALLPTAGPPMIRILERTPGVGTPVLARVSPRPGEMLWLASQSGINGAVVDLALEARRRGLLTVAFTSRAHSESVASRHPSGKRLFEVCDHVVDLGGYRGDAAVEIAPGMRAGALSTLGTVTSGHSILVRACAILESNGHRCVYTSVNTPEGQSRNRALEEKAAEHDPLLRE